MLERAGVEGAVLGVVVVLGEVEGVACGHVAHGACAGVGFDGEFQRGHAQLGDLAGVLGAQRGVGAVVALACAVVYGHLWQATSAQGAAGLCTGGDDLLGVQAEQGHCGGAYLALGTEGGDGVGFFCGVCAVEADVSGVECGPLVDTGGSIEDDQAVFGVGGACVGLFSGTCGSIGWGGLFVLKAQLKPSLASKRVRKSRSFSWYWVQMGRTGSGWVTSMRTLAWG